MTTSNCLALACLLLAASVLALHQATAALASHDNVHSAGASAVNASTITGKVLFGYQGWFGPSPKVAPQYGYAHWSRNSQPPNATNAAFDVWPDFSEYPETAMAPAGAGFKYADGSPVKVYSATAGGAGGGAVATHFRWMQEYGLDGVFLQRFASEIQSFSGQRYEFRNQVTAEVAAEAAASGRVWALEWDITGADESNIENTLSNDFAINIRQYTTKPGYLHHNGKPVVAIFGMGFTGDRYPSNVQAAINTIRNLQIAYNVYVVGGVPFFWRTGTRDSRPGWLSVYQTFDALSPWAVGRYNSAAAYSTLFAQETQPDRSFTVSHGLAYAPVLWPGFSWANLQQDPSDFNSIPRLGGTFFQAQADAIVQRLAPAADFVFGAMFDEWNEGTAIAKLAATKAQLPTTGRFLYANIDPGVTNLQSDHYLVLAGALTKSFASVHRSEGV